LGGNEEIKMKRLGFWGLFGVTFGIYGVMLAWSLPTISAAAGGLAPFDMRPGGYSFAEALAFLTALTPEGAAFYRGTQHLLDLFYPGLLALTLYFAIAALLPKRLGAWLWVVALIAVPTGLFDYLENGAVTAMLDAGPAGLTPALVETASRFTLLKAAGSTLAMSTLLVLPIAHGARGIAPWARRTMARRPLTSFVVLGLILSAPVQAIATGLGLSMFWASALGVILGLTGPVLLVTAAEGGRKAVIALLRQALLRPASIGWLSVAAFGLVVALVLAASLLQGAAPFTKLGETWLGLFTSYLPEMLLTFVCIQLFEEFAWTGFLQSRLQDRNSALRASLIVAPVFALSHLMINWLGSGDIVAAFAMLAVQLVFAVFFRITITTLFNLAGGSVIVAAVFHAAFNTANGAFIKGLIGPDAMWLLLALVALAAIVAVVATRGRMGTGGSSRQSPLVPQTA
jgi:membrane protease YdiL (CAAX protease family)